MRTDPVWWEGRKDRAFGVVYIMGGDGGPLKVGQSTNVVSRLKTLRWELRRELLVLFSLEVPTADLIGVEQLAHFLMRESALGRELFDITLEAARDAVCDAKEAYDRGRRAPQAADDPNRASVGLGVTLPVDVLARVCDWRASQRKIPSRSAAIRQLLELGLGEAGKGDTTRSE